MKCVNCEKEMPSGVEQCPHCGCHYPEIMKDHESKSSPSDVEIDKSSVEKQITELIDAIAIKGFATEKDRKAIIRTAQKGGIDPDVVEIKLDAALAKVQQRQKKEEKTVRGTTPVNTIEKPKVVKDSDSGKKIEDVHPFKTAKEDDEIKTTPKAQIQKSISETKNASIRYCKKCGSPLSSEARFCKKCGSKI